MRRSSIREIRKNANGGQYQFDVIIMDKNKCRLSANFTDSFNWSRNEQVNFEIDNRRLIQLANDILNYFNKEAILEMFEPKLEDLEKKLEEQWGVENYVLDLVRMPNQVEATKRIYEWLKSNEKWIYERKN